MGVVVVVVEPEPEPDESAGELPVLFLQANTDTVIAAISVAANKIFLIKCRYWLFLYQEAIIKSKLHLAKTQLRLTGLLFLHIDPVNSRALYNLVVIRIDMVPVVGSV